MGWNKSGLEILHKSTFAHKTVQVDITMINGPSGIYTFFSKILLTMLYTQSINVSAQGSKMKISNPRKKNIIS